MKRDTREMLIIALSMLSALILFAVLYSHSLVPKAPLPEPEETSSLDQWSLETSVANGQPLGDDKSIYTRDNSIYDVYISVFPTRDETGKIIDLSAFSLHHARDHSYNPTLSCNIQIQPEGGRPDPLVNLNEPNATIRVRGNSSRGDEYKSYKIKLREDAGTFFGQTSLNINKHCEDEFKVVTKFCTDILQEVPHVPSFQTNFMRVWIRDASLPEKDQEFAYYGLFTNTEQPNKTYLNIRGLSPNCVLYKARDFSFQLDPAFLDVNDANYDPVAFEARLGIREGTDHKKLLDLLAAVNNESLDVMELFGTYFNEDNYLSWLAFNLLVGADDILNHNYLIYSPNNSRTWYFFPWDFDSDMQNSYDDYVPESLRGGQKLNMVSLHRRYFRVPGNLQKLQARMEEMLQGPLSPENISSVTSGYCDVLEKTMYLEPDVGLIPCEPGELIPRIENFPEIVRNNYETFVKAFNYPAPMFVSEPLRNDRGGIHLAWDSSYSYQQRTITYRVQIASDCRMENILYEKDNIIETSLDADIRLKPGTYYLKVFAIDSEGNEQISLEHYEFSGPIFIYESGVLEFTLS